MSDKAINRLFMAYLHNYYCNYHWDPIPRIYFRVWLFFAYFGHVFSLFWRRGPGNPGAVPGPRICHFTRTPSLSASSRPVLLGADHECGLPNNTANRVMHCNTIFARRRIFTRVAMYTVNSRPAEFHKITIPFPAQTMRV